MRSVLSFASAFLLLLLPDLTTAQNCLSERDKKLICDPDISDVVCCELSDSSVCREVWQLEEIWRVGSEDDEGILLSFVPHVLVVNEDVFVLDTKLSRVYKLALDTGHVVGVYNVGGEGPGHSEHPSGILYLDRGKYGLFNALNSRIITTDLRDNAYQTLFLRIRDAGESLSIANSFRYHTGEKELLVYQETYRFDDMKYVCTLSGFSLSDSMSNQRETVRYLHQVHDSEYARRGQLSEERFEYFGNKDLFDYDSNNIYVVPYRDEYKIFVFSRDGNLSRVIMNSSYRHRYRSDEEIVYESYVAPGLYMDVEDTAPDILGIHCYDGGILVRTSRSDVDQPPDIFRTYDYIKHGVLCKRISLAYHKAARDRVVFFNSGLVVILKGYYDAMRPGISDVDMSIELEPMQVILCRVVDVRLREKGFNGK